MAARATSSRNVLHTIDRWFPAPLFLLPNAAGVDISDYSIKWMTLRQGDVHEVLAWGNEPLPEGIVKGGLIQDVKELAHAIKKIRPHLGSLAAHAALPEEAAYVFDMQVPLGSDRQQMLNMIEFEFDGRVPISPSAAVYDFNTIEIVPDDPEKGEQIGVVVFPRDLAESYGAAFQQADIALLSLEVEARSIARAVSSRSEHEPITLLVDFGRARTGIAVIKRGIPIFTSTVEVGGNMALDALQRFLGISRQDAELVCNREGLLGAGNGKGSGVEALLPTVSSLADEIERHFRYWDTRRNDKGERVTPVSRIVLVGGSSNMRGLGQYIAGRVHASVELGNIWRHVVDFEEYIPPINQRTSLQFATAAGLALRSL